MQNSQDIVCISMTTWEGDYMKTIVHMMSQLAKNHRVLFVDYPFTAKDAVMSVLGKSKAPVKRMLGIRKRLRTLETKHAEVYHLTLPPILPTNWINDAETFEKIVSSQSWIIERSIKKAMHKLNFVSPIVINAFNPIIGLPLVGKLNESKLIYYCYDEIRAAEWCGKHGGLMEDRFIEKADAVIVTSEELFKSKSAKNSNTTLVKNGVDFDLFYQAFHTESNVRKVVGYVGSIDFRLDYDLLESVIKSRPNYDFHFVGRVTDKVGHQRLASYSNVKFFGAQQPNAIPDFMQKFDVGIIPFAINDFTKSIYPLKINEYLAAGIPVVSTDFASLVDFYSFISIVTKPEQFGIYLDKEMDSDTINKKHRRAAIAEMNDWSERAEQVEAILNTKANA